MASFKICVRQQRSDKLFPVYIRITHNRKVGYIKTDKVVTTSKLRKGEIKDPEILSYGSNLIKNYSERLNAVDISFWDIHDIIFYLQNIDKDISFSKYARKYVLEMATLRKMERNAKNYKWAYMSLEKYAGTDNIMFSKLTTQFMSSPEIALQQKR